MKTLSIDLETRSSVDIGKCGVYKYAESPDFDILLFGVSVDGGPITVYDLASGDTIPDSILVALSDETVTKWAYNASFERVCLSIWLRRHYPRYFSTYSIEGDLSRITLIRVPGNARWYGRRTMACLSGWKRSARCWDLRSRS